MRIMSAFLVATFTFGCREAPQGPNPTVPTPNPIVLAGELDGGNATATELRRQGFNVDTVLNGRAEGLAAFCMSEADAMVIQNITPQEHQQCRDLRAGDNWGWSAMSTENGASLYIRRGYADDFIARRNSSRE